jgi:hypothetical protein
VSETQFRTAALAVCTTFVAAAAVDGAAFTQMASDMVRETWCASDAAIAAVEQAQFDLGEGPTREAYLTQQPVLVADVQNPRTVARWPMFTEQTASLDIGSLFAIPMRVGAITAGVCSAYRRKAGALSAAEVGELLRAVDAATLTLLALRAGNAQQRPENDEVEGTLPRHVHQATGMVVAQLGVSIEEAFARLRAHAYSSGRTLDEVAGEIVDRRLRLEPDPPPDPVQID